MENLRKAIEERESEKLEKAKYTKRTGSPGNYKYEYGRSGSGRSPKGADVKRGSGYKSTDGSKEKKASGKEIQKILTGLNIHACDELAKKGVTTKQVQAALDNATKNRKKNEAPFKTFINAYNSLDNEGKGSIVSKEWGVSKKDLEEIQENGSIGISNDGKLYSLESSDGDSVFNRATIMPDGKVKVEEKDLTGEMADIIENEDDSEMDYGEDPERNGQIMKGICEKSKKPWKEKTTYNDVKSYIKSLKN